MKGQFGPNGALFDGWESRRHNPTYDWVIVKLGALGEVAGVDIDTGCFSGNEVSHSTVARRTRLADADGGYCVAAVTGEQRVGRQRSRGRHPHC